MIFLLLTIAKEIKGGRNWKFPIESRQVNTTDIQEYNNPP